MTPTELESYDAMMADRDRWKRQAKAYKTALHIIRTWATVHGGISLEPQDVDNLITKTLEQNND